MKRNIAEALMLPCSLVCAGGIIYTIWTQELVGAKVAITAAITLFCLLVYVIFEEA